MRKRVLGFFVFVFIVVVATTLITYFATERDEGARTQLQLVEINEIEKLVEDGDAAKASAKLSDYSDSLRQSMRSAERNPYILLVGGIAAVLVIAAGIFVYATVIRPLNKISKFTAEIAKGNTDIPLEYDRGSEVGEFSWAFDSMRHELRKARAAEKEAIENNKTVIATLSHDIKTPIASIRAYTEGLEANLDSSPERRAKYLQVIMRKSDEVSKVTDDLLLHSLSDMNRLQVELKELDISVFAESAVKDLDPDGKDVSFSAAGAGSVVGSARGVGGSSGDDSDRAARLGQTPCIVRADPDRLLQCLENLVTNARKYAGSRIEVYLERAGSQAGKTVGDAGKEGSDAGNSGAGSGASIGSNQVAICVKDFGKGIPDEDLPFIFDKFYRGHNHGGQPGSGLGLYIVKYLMTQMNGDILLSNQPDGLLAKLVLPVEKPSER